MKNISTRESRIAMIVYRVVKKAEAIQHNKGTGSVNSPSATKGVKSRRMSESYLSTIR